MQSSWFCWKHYTIQHTISYIYVYVSSTNKFKLTSRIHVNYEGPLKKCRYKQETNLMEKRWRPQTQSDCAALAGDWKRLIQRGAPLSTLCECVGVCEGWGLAADSLKVLRRCVPVMKCEWRVCVHNTECFLELHSLRDSLSPESSPASDSACHPSQWHLK